MYQICKRKWCRLFEPSFRNHKKQGRNNRDNAYNEAMHDEHVMISEPDYNTGLIEKAPDCPRTHVPVHCTETPTPVSTAMSLKRGTTTAQYGPDGLPPPPSFLLTTKSQGHHYESPTFTWYNILNNPYKFLNVNRS